MDRNKKVFISPEVTKKSNAPLSPTLQNLKNGFIKSSNFSDCEDQIPELAEAELSPGLAAIRRREKCFDFSDETDSAKQEGILIYYIYLIY